jgi:acyl carrier protein
MSDVFTDRLKVLIVATLNLDGIRPEEIPDDESLIGSPRFGLDSIDALELVLAIEKEFGVKIGSSEESRLALGSVNSLAAYLRSHPVRPRQAHADEKPVSLTPSATEGGSPAFGQAGGTHRQEDPSGDRVLPAHSRDPG